MHIAMVFDGLGFGGIERVGINYAKMLIGLGHKVTIINLQPKANALEGNFPQDCEIVHASFPTIALPGYFLPIIKKWWWGKYLYSGTCMVTQLALSLYLVTHPRRRSYDIAIAFSGHIRDMTYIAHNCIQADKVLAWVHGSLADYLLSSYSFADLYAQIRNLCVLSEEHQDQAIRYNDKLCGKLNIALLLNPIEQSPSIENGHLVKDLKQRYGNFIVMVGRFDRDKDQRTVLEAQKLLENHYGLSPYFLFIGDGPTRSICEDYAKTLGVEERAIFLGARYDVDSFYAAAQVAVHSSPSEGLPTVLLEAMRCGTPIVATDSRPGVPTILGDNEFGLICAVGNPEDMAAKIARMMSDAQLRQEYSAKGLERIKAFSFEQISSELQSILNKLV